MKYGYLLNLNYVHNPQLEAIWVDGDYTFIETRIHEVSNSDMVLIGNAQEFNQWLEINKKEDNNA